MATLHPDNTWQKVVFDPGAGEHWDGDVHRGASLGPPDRPRRRRLTIRARRWAVRRCLRTVVQPADRRYLRGERPDQEARKNAAQKAVRHASTPPYAHTDSLATDLP